MIRADREMLAELARLNSDVVPLAMRIMGNDVTADEQHEFAQRLIAMARQLQARASVTVIEGDVMTIPGNEALGQVESRSAARRDEESELGFDRLPTAEPDRPV